MTGLRVGVVGLGRAGLLHAGNLARHPDVERVTLLARDERKGVAALGRLHEAADELARPITAETAAIAGTIAGHAHELDAVVVATSTPSHPLLAREAVAAGLPSLVEKPFTLDPDALARDAAELDAQPVPVMLGFHRRYDPAFRQARELAVSGGLGALRLVRTTNLDRSALDPDYIPHSGGLWLDMAIHDFDAVPWVTGQRVVRVTALGAVLDAPVHSEHGDVDTGAALLELESGAIALVASTRRNDSGQDCRLEVIGSERSVAVGVPRAAFDSLDPGAAERTDADAPYNDFTERFAPAFRAEIDRFVRLARGEAENETPVGAGIHALEIAIACRESVARRGAPVELASR